MEKIRKEKEVRIFLVKKGDVEIGYYRKLVMVSEVLGIPVTRLRNWGSRTKYRVRFYYMKYEVIPCKLVDGWYYESGDGERIKRVRENLGAAREKKGVVNSAKKKESPVIEVVEKVVHKSVLEWAIERMEIETEEGYREWSRRLDECEYLTAKEKAMARVMKK